MTDKFNPTSKDYSAYLKDKIKNLFSNHGINAYNLKASTKAEYPYIVYELRQIGNNLDDCDSKRFVLDINAYDTGNFGVIDNLFDYIERLLINYKYDDSKCFFNIYEYIGRSAVDEESPLVRKRIQLELRFYWKG